MAEHPAPSHRRPPDGTGEAQAKARTSGGAAAATGHVNPPEPGWVEGPRYPNPPDPANPDPATLREQWLFAIRRYSRWYSRAWGAAILAGGALFALGWAVKGDNPLPSRHREPQRGAAAGQEP
ncbi:hypothetical protein ACP70R_030709 [Stipagrostis hirtigluma subsp. patula]